MEGFLRNLAPRALLVSLVAAVSILLTKQLVAADPGDPTVGRWTQSGNGPGHTGFYPATLGQVPIVLGWTKSFDGLPINQVVISDGRVLVTSTGYTAKGDGASNPFAAALDSATGNELWRNPGPGFLDAPIVSDGHVFFQANDSKLHALRSADGFVEWTPELYTVAATPTVLGDRLWANSSTGVFGLRISDHSQRFFAASSQGYGCRHSYYVGVLYVCESGIFRALDAETGVRLWTLSLPLKGDVGQEDDVPAIMNGKASVVTTSGGLTTVDLKTKSILWSVAGNFYRRPATDGATIYAIVNGGGVNAYAADTGQLRGRYNMPRLTGEFVPRGSQPLVTNDLVILGANQNTYVFDKATFELWATLPGGYLSYAAGILYIADLAGNLLTYTFQGAPAEPAPTPWPSPTPTPGPTPRDKVELVSVNREGTATANLYSFAQSISTANGRYILFSSGATDLTALPDTNRFNDLFVRDLQTGITELVTVNAAGTAAGRSGYEDQFGNAKLTPDGHYAVFTSWKFDLVPLEPDFNSTDVFVRDLVARHTVAATVALDGSLVGGYGADISADGRYVMFTSAATNLVKGPGNGATTNAYVRDLQTNQTILASVDQAGLGFASASGMAISKNGRFVLFQASVSTPTGFRLQWFLRDLQSETTQLITANVSGNPSTNGSSGRRALMSQDGRYVAFESSTTDLVANDPNGAHTDIFVRDTVAKTTERINSDDNTDAALGDISPDGMVIGFFASRDAGLPSPYICDRRAGTTQQLIAGGAFPNDADGIAGGMRMDPTGRLVFFQSSDNVSFGINNDTNFVSDVFVTDRQLKTTRLISHDVTGTRSGNERSGLGGITDDGQTVVFNSAATNIVSIPDTNNSPSLLVPDVFVSTTEASGRLLNISTRGDVQAGDKALIGGFVLTGNTPKNIMIRAIGPSLRAAGLQNSLADPTLELYDRSGVLVATNDNWKENQTEIEATGIPPSNELESALVRSLSPGAYTAVVRGKDNSTGTGLVELYDLEQGADSMLANISTRGFVETGDNVMIAGFIAGGGGGGAAKVLVRALGPSLGNFGVAGALQDPILELRDPNGALVASNDDWKTTQRTEIEATGIPPTNDAESATVNKLAPGPYTAIVRGKNNATGVALVEVYNIQ
jgi:outer membrane protein assembly factor BamB